MRDLYRVLGVCCAADNEEIKSAFRTLAKELHPDLHPGDAGAAQRFQDVIGAYETLSDPKLRAAYEARMADHHSLMRRHFRGRMATMATAFAVTVCSVPVVMFWDELSGVLLASREYSVQQPSEGTHVTAPSGAVVTAPAKIPAQTAIEGGGPPADKSLEVAHAQPTSTPASDSEPVTQPLPQHKADVTSSAFGPSTEPEVESVTRLRLY
jgi:hypothetical protein